MIDFKGVRRTLGALLCLAFVCLAACGGGGASAPADIKVPDFSLPRTVGFTEQGSNARANVWTLDQTDAAGVNKGPGTFTLQFDVKSTGYYAQNPGSHWAVITRADNHRNAADGNQGIWGAGLACGRLFYGPDPRCLLESWYADKPDDHWLYDKTLGPVLTDSVAYSVTVESRVNDDGTRALRYAIADVYDSGFIVDANNDYDPAMTGLAVGYVFDTAGATWRLDFSNVRYRWSR
jgi:hypothetical protein